MAEMLTNKVAASGIITLDPADFFPKHPIAVFDLKDHLFMGLILKEKDFREALKNFDTSAFTAKIAAVTCSADAVIPMWAYMLVASLLQPVAADVLIGDEKAVQEKLLLKNIERFDASPHTDARVVLKGCGELPIPESAYVALTNKLRPLAKSIMYGEPCSTVPVFKQPIVRTGN